MRQSIPVRLIISVVKDHKRRMTFLPGFTGRHGACNQLPRSGVSRSGIRAGENRTVRRAVHLAIASASLVAAFLAATSTSLTAATNPIATPAGLVRFYLHALGARECDLAFKFAGQASHSLHAFRQDCRTIRRIAIDRLSDPGYHLRRQNAAYTCLAVRYTVYRRAGVTTLGGWYLMERTLGPAWRLLFTHSHLTTGGSAIHLTTAQCARRLPSYVHPGSGILLNGTAFRTSAAGWIASAPSVLSGRRALPCPGCGSLQLVRLQRSM